ncbi:uncharacterized protein LOC103311552 [Acyrthosiphon pisum]|uniref:Uncharacterized protein n=1 Tax=Acyrthosiphon pisum TaxID=7029 RepID=A0A8R2BAX5_ACYPI|nr:uncharacterized protein LOC103311552 [Acyrthosiphon pisum]|eukprot:XP_008189419.1 PREDICTED: uncharacterized protein LOC103311552 [Acyrthosiphon pisum]
MREYQDSNHMEKVLPHDEHQPVIYIPHRHICRPTSTTTKLRVVFDGSSIMDSGLALNDYLLKGPKLQKDIICILINFRFSRYVFSADIKQMFRQMLIHHKYRPYQCILWRNELTGPVIPYRLNTVTYGMVTSPYQALRTLRQLSEDEEATYPVASKLLKRDFYGDKVMTGMDTTDQLLCLQQELNSLLERGGFKLRKWASNCPAILEKVPLEHRVTQLPLHNDSDTAVKLLGVS